MSEELTPEQLRLLRRPAPSTLTLREQVALLDEVKLLRAVLRDVHAASTYPVQRGLPAAPRFVMSGRTIVDLLAQVPDLMEPGG